MAAVLVPFVAGHVFGVFLCQPAALFVEPLAGQLVVRPPTAGFPVESLRRRVINGPWYAWAGRQ